MKKKKITKFIFIVLILCISIGFAVLTTNLGVNANLSFKENTFDVHFENIETINTSTVTNQTSTITDPTSISFSGTFNKPGDYIEFSFYIVNNGTINAQLNSITTNLTVEQQNYIEYNYKYEIENSNVNINDYLYVGQSRKVIARFTYKEDIDQFINLESLNLTLNMKFIQPETVTTTVWNYEYSGTEQYFIVPKTGTYKLEVWGAQGGYGYAPELYRGGYGGYSTGNMTLEKGKQLNVVVGGTGASGCLKEQCAGGYNGGGISGMFTSDNQNYNGGGGGATHIAFRNGLLSELEDYKGDIIVVSGGGAGSVYRTQSMDGISGGSGGGYIGGIQVLIDVNNWGNSTPGTQTSPGSGYGIEAGFGHGGDGTGHNCPGGGSGYYGGGTAGSGGSGYIGNPNLTEKIMYCYNCQESTSEADETNIKTRSTTNVSETPTSQYAKIGNGYARITYIG